MSDTTTATIGGVAEMLDGSLAGYGES